MVSRRSVIVALVASIGVAVLLPVVYTIMAKGSNASPVVVTEDNYAPNIFRDHNLQVTLDYTENNHNENKQSFVLTVKNIGQDDLQLNNVDLAGYRCDVQPTCDGHITVMDYRMVGIDSALPMNPVYDQDLTLSSGNMASASINGSWPQAERFAVATAYSLKTGNPWLDEYTFGVHSTLIYNNSSIESLKDSIVAVDEALGGVSVQYWRQYDGMPEPKVYAFKSLSLNNTESAMHELQNIAKNRIDPRSTVKAIVYDSDATINISYMATTFSFPLSREVAALTQTTREAAYVLALMPEKLTSDQLDLLSSKISAYNFSLIGYADNYASVVNQDENIQVFLKHRVVINNASSDEGSANDYVEIYIKNIGTRPSIIESANVYAKNIFDGGASSSKFIYSFIGDGDSFAEPQHPEPIRLEPMQQTVGLTTGNWSDWHYFEAEVKYTIDRQVRALNTIISDVERTAESSSDNN